jgi:hypothetical protein
LLFSGIAYVSLIKITVGVKASGLGILLGCFVRFLLIFLLRYAELVLDPG